MRAIEMRAEMRADFEEIKELLGEIVDEKTWKIEEMPEFNEITAEYNDSCDYESITLSTWRNEYGVKFYKVIVKQADKQNDEVIRPEVAAQHGFDLAEFYGLEDIDDDDELDKKILEKAEELEEKVEKELDEWYNKPSMNTKVLANEIQLFTLRLDEVCYLNITHKHSYKAIGLKAITQDLDILKAILMLRDLLISLYRDFLRKLEKI